MLELLFLLLPVAAAYGWYMGRRSAQQSKQEDASRLSRDYVAGMNFLLSNQQDKAVDLFLDMLKEDTGTVEAHLTLGNLFRSRGEVDRAIRIHQTLMESASLTYDQRLLAIGLLWPRRRTFTIVLLLAWATAVMGSRLVLGMHWPRDLIASTIVSWLLVTLATWLTRKLCGPLTPPPEEASDIRERAE